MVIDAALAEVLGEVAALFELSDGPGEGETAIVDILYAGPFSGATPRPIWTRAYRVPDLRCVADELVELLPPLVAFHQLDFSPEIGPPPAARRQLVLGVLKVAHCGCPGESLGQQLFGTRRPA